MKELYGIFSSFLIIDGVLTVIAWYAYFVPSTSLLYVVVLIPID